MAKQVIASRRLRPAHGALGRAVLAGLAFLIAALVLAGCSESPPVKAGACEAHCAGKSGGDDGCGGTCPVAPAPDAGSCDRCGPSDTCLDGRCVCQPRCDGKHVGSDGCGGSCACAPGTVQNGAGECVSPASCTDTCAGVGVACGDVCGKSCGTCGDAKSCTQGKCLCVAKCDGTRCDDGCGGICACGAGTACAADGRCVAPADCHDSCDGAGRTCGDICGTACGACGADQGCSGGKCQALVTCVDCDLDIHVLSAVGGKMTVAVDFAPQAGSASPRLADVRFRASSAIRITKVTPGEALTGAGKELFVDPQTGQPWRVRADGAYQLLIQSTASVSELHAGRVATLEVDAPASGSVILWLVRRDQVFAPPVADDALQSTPYDSPVTVSR